MDSQGDQATHRVPLPVAVTTVTSVTKALHRMAKAWRLLPIMEARPIVTVGAYPPHPYPPMTRCVITP